MTKSADKKNESKTSWGLIAFCGLVVFALCLPLSNLLIKRTTVAPADDPEFKKVSDVMVRKCADCHTAELAQHPLYFGFPIADSIIQQNIKKGHYSFMLSSDKLAGKEKFTSSDLDKLSAAMAKNNMPPPQYLMLHWDSALTESEQHLLATWAHKRSKIYDLRPIPTENFFKPDPLKAALGQKLFNDKGMSLNNSMSCASCHSLEHGGTDNLQVSAPVNGVASTLNTPTVLNAAYNIYQYWDGRAKTLKQQVDMAMTNPHELASNWQQAIENLRKEPDVVAAFQASYPQGITSDSVSDAIAEYERTLLTPGSRFDKYTAGDTTALNDEERAGFEVFKKHECFDCHSGPAFGGLSFETMGFSKVYFSDNSKINTTDRGRFNVTHNKADMYRFKVPSLRNVALTYPYLHDGSAKTLEDAVKVMSEFEVDNDKALSADEVKKVVAFLKTLTGTLPKSATATLPGSAGVGRAASLHSPPPVPPASISK